MQIDVVGLKMYKLVEELCPICRSITGDGVRQTLKVITKHLPELKIHEIPTGEQCFDFSGLGITPGWDSLRHIGIILDLEKQYNFKFSSQDIDKFTTVRQIVQTISNFSLRTTNNGK
jgi:acyl carrier protein